MLFQKILLFVNIIIFNNSKNIILPFKKISIEDFNGRKTIDDLITFNIYTNISMGTPPQIVAHFIEQDDYCFNFKKRLLSYNNVKSSQFLENYENLTNFWFDNKKSSTFIMDNDKDFCSDIFYFTTLNSTIKRCENLRHNIYLSDILDKQKCGIIGLDPKSSKKFNTNKLHISFLEELKEKDIISENSLTILYEENNNLLNYNNNLNLGTIIIGESPHIFAPDKYDKDDIVVNLEKDWSILVNEVKFNSPKSNYTEENVDLKFSLVSGFIKGSSLYRKEIDKIFFSELIKNNLCNVDLLDENVFPNEYYVYSCENNKEMNENIKSFPSLSFEIKTNNLTFNFTYNELFKVFNDRLYFMIIFRYQKYSSSYLHSWTMGDIFLRKYLTTYNYESKTILFYRNQVDEINIKSQLVNESSDLNTNNNFSKYLRTFLEVIMGIFILLILYLLYRKYRRTRKIHANELEDSNYDYVSQENKTSALSQEQKQRELNKIIK